MTYYCLYCIFERIFELFLIKNRYLVLQFENCNIISML